MNQVELVKEMTKHLGLERVKEIKDVSNKVETVLKENKALTGFNREIKENGRKDRNYYEICLTANTVGVDISGCFIFDDTVKGADFWWNINFAVNKVL